MQRARRNPVTGEGDCRAAQVESFVAAAPHSHFMQSPVWLHTFADERESVDYIVTLNERGAIMACSGVRRVCGPRWLGDKCFVDGGPVFEAEAQLERHLADLFAATRDAAFVRIRPYLPAANGRVMRELLADHAFELLPPARQSGYSATLVLDLSRGVDRLFAQFSTGLKRNLRRAERCGVRIEQVRENAPIAEFAYLLSNAAGRAGYEVPAPDRLARYLEIVLGRADGSAALFCARVDSQLRAGIVVLKAGTSVVYQWGARSQPAPGDDGLPLTHALHWEAIRWAQAQGFGTYDFGGLSDNGARTGIDRFKEAFGGERRAMFGEAVCVRGPLARVMNWPAGRMLARLRTRAHCASKQARAESRAPAR